MENRYKEDVGNDCLLSVDGTDCRIQKKGRRWSSHKFAKKAGVRYEVGVAIKSGDICWINGPYPCGQFADITIFREGIFWVMMKGWKQILATLASTQLTAKLQVLCMLII